MQTSTRATPYAPRIDWDDPSARAALAERIGPAAYNAAQTEHIRRSALETVNGHSIRPVSSRFGRLFMVGATGQAFPTLGQARLHATRTPQMSPTTRMTA